MELKLSSPEQEPSNEAAFYVHFRGLRIEGTPENSYLIMHEETYSQYDCIQIAIDGEEAEALRMKGIVCFRAVMGNFDDVAEYMMDNNFRVHYNDEPSQFHLDRYKEFEADRRKAEAARMLEAPVPLKELYPRHERMIKYFAWYMDNGGIERELYG